MSPTMSLKQLKDNAVIIVLAMQLVQMLFFSLGYGINSPGKAIGDLQAQVIAIKQDHAQWIKMTEDNTLVLCSFAPMAVKQNWQLPCARLFRERGLE